MDERAEKALIRMFYLVIFVAFVFILLQNLSDPWLMVFLSGILISSITVRNALIYQSTKYSRYGKLLLIFDIAIIYIVSSFDKSQSSILYWLVIIADAAAAYPPRFSLLYTLLCLAVYTVSKYVHSSDFDPFQFISHLGTTSLTFVSVMLIMNFVKYEIKQRRKLSDAMFELKIKSKQLENTYLKLKSTSEELEELTIVKERNRIAREIHDTVGHTLTTVLLEMEVCERLLKPSPEQALDKLHLAKEQVRKGLQDIRESVRTLQSGRELMDFVPSLKLLIEETTRHGNIFVKYEISNLPKLNETQERVIYRALQEGLTNGIKHGGSTAFVFLLNYEKEKINFSLQDNGKGTDNIVSGFGLTAMSERVKEAGGILRVSSAMGEGFHIGISIPVKNTSN